MLKDSLKPKPAATTKKLSQTTPKTTTKEKGTSPVTPQPPAGEITDKSTVSPEARESQDTPPRGMSMEEITRELGKGLELPEEPGSFQEEALGALKTSDSDSDGHLGDDELRAAQSADASAGTAAAAAVTERNVDDIEGLSNDEWFAENDGPTANDIKGTDESVESAYGRELSRQRLWDGQGDVDDLPHGYDSVFGAEPTHEQKLKASKRLVTAADLNSADRTEGERRSGVTVVDRQRTEDGELRPGIDRLLAVSAPQGEDEKALPTAAQNQGATGQGTEHDDIFRLRRAYDSATPEDVERTNKAIRGESVPYVGSRAAYETNAHISSDHDLHGSPQFTDGHTGTATPLGSDINLELGGGNNTVHIDQPINITGQPAQHTTNIEGSPNGNDTYHFDEGLMSREVMPANINYNGSPLFELTGDQVESSDTFNITQGEGGTSRFRIPTNRRPKLSPDNPLVQSGRLRYEGEYLVMTQ